MGYFKILIYVTGYGKLEWLTPDDYCCGDWEYVGSDYEANVDVVYSPSLREYACTKIFGGC